jgi:HemY protein
MPLRSLKVLEKERLMSDEIALLWLLADEDEKAGNTYFMVEKLQSAYRLDPYNVPVILRLGKHYLTTSRWKIAGMIEKAWKKNPHPDLAALWDKLAPPRKEGEGMKRLKWHEKLNAFHGGTVTGHLALAMVAMEESLWGQAKEHLIAAQNLKATVQVYRLRAKLEEQTTKDDVAMRHWLELAADAPADETWYCTRTGKTYDEWAPIAMPHKAFNTIRWGQPFAAIHSGEATQLPLWKDALMIDQG